MKKLPKVIKNKDTGTTYDKTKKYVKCIDDGGPYFHGCLTEDKIYEVFNSSNLTPNSMWIELFDDQGNYSWYLKNSFEDFS